MQNGNLKFEFFIPMIPPTITAQEKGIGRKGNGKAYVYTKPEVKEAADRIRCRVPMCSTPMQGSVRLITKWLYPTRDVRKNGSYKDTRPDTDNVEKMLKDILTSCGYWMDDAQVASEIVEKLWTYGSPGIFIQIEELNG